MTIDVKVRYAELVAEDVLDLLRSDGGWMSSHALLQRSVLVRDNEELAKILNELSKRERIQRRSGPIGLEYALTGVPVPAVMPAALSAARQAARDEGTDRVVSAMLCQRPHERREALRHDVISLFRAKNVRTSRELQVAISRSQSSVKVILLGLKADGLVVDVGANRLGTRGYRWIGGDAK